MANKVTAVMLEVTGQCERRCPLCLPARLRTNKILEIPDILLLGKQFREAGINTVTLCGYGNPVGHPALNNIVWALGCRLKMEVNIVCRPDQVGKAWMLDNVFVSIDSLADAQALRDSPFNPFLPWLFPFVMLTDKSALELEAILDVLTSHSCIPLISITHPMILCDDPEHRRLVTETNKNLPANEDRMAGVIKSMPKDWHSRIRYYGSNQFRKVCRFHGSSKPMIYIDADLKVRMCCHKPVSEPLGDLTKETLASVLAGPVAKFHDTWEQNEVCRLCPEDGLAVLG